MIYNFVADANDTDDGATQTSASPLRSNANDLTLIDNDLYE